MGDPEEGFREDWETCCPSSTNCICPDAVPVCRLIQAPLIDTDSYTGIASSNEYLFNKYFELVDKYRINS